MSSPLEAEAIGQGTLTVTPLQMALVAATVANDGDMPVPQLVMAVQDRHYRWQQVESENAHPVLPADIARTVLSAWRSWSADVGTSADGTVFGHWGTAVAGEGRPHSWFIGVSPPTGGNRYVVAVLVEHASEPQHAVSIGCQLLASDVLTAD